jgi:hypothetical protein
MMRLQVYTESRSSKMLSMPNHVQLNSFLEAAQENIDLLISVTVPQCSPLNAPAFLHINLNSNSTPKP